MFSWECCEISKDTFFTEHLWTTASVKNSMDDYDPMDKANWFYHFIEVVPEYYHPLCYINTEETCAVNVKTQIESFKNKDGYLNVFQLQYFLYSHIVSSKVYFSCTFYLFFVIILRKRIVSKHWNMYFSTKLTQYYCKCKIKLDSRIFLFVCFMVFAEHLRISTHFFPSKHNVFQILRL